jgi:hypothetical protein
LERARRREELRVGGPAAGVGVDMARRHLLSRLRYEGLVDAREQLVRHALVDEQPNRGKDQRHHQREAECEPDADRELCHLSARSR